MKKLYSLMALAAFASGAGAQTIITDEWEMGQLVEIEGKQYVVGRNLIDNGSFSNDPSTTDNVYYGWGRAKDGYTEGLGTTPELSYPASQATWNATGGYDGGSYITLGGCGGAASETALVGHWNISQNSEYYFGFYLKDYIAKVASANYKYAPVVSLAKGVSPTCSTNEDNKLFGDGAQYTTDLFVSSDDWSPVGVIFSNSEYNWLQFRISWTNSGVGLDGFRLHKLYDAANIDPDNPKSAIAILDYMDALDAISFYVDSELADYTSIADEAYDYVMFHQNYQLEGEYHLETVEEFEAATVEAQTYLVGLQKTTEAISGFYTQLEEIALVLDDSNPYPGIDELSDAYETYYEYAENGFESLDENVPSSEYVAKALVSLIEAVEAYRMSQDASEDNPADYSFYIDNPVFAAQGKWYIGAEGGVQQMLTVDGRTCWQTWQNTATSGVRGVYQNIEGLPNGYYSVTADMTTQTGCITDQHVVAKSSTNSAVSGVLTDESIDVMGAAGVATNVTWETMTTEKVIVVDGKLTIGAEGSLSDELTARNDYRTGSLWVTNFKLNYLGEASEADYAAAIADRIAAAKEYAEKMHYAGDKAVLLTVAEATVGVEMLDSLNSVYAMAEASEADYEAVMTGSYAELQDSIANSEIYSADAKELAQVPVDYMTAYLVSDTATYKNSGSITTVIRYYRDTLIPALQTCETVLATTVSEEGKAAVAGTISSVKSALSIYVGNMDVLAEQVAALNNAVRIAEVSDIVYGEGADVTAYISNASVVDSKATGWIQNKIVGDGDGAKSGQAKNGNASDYYIDTYNYQEGALRATYYQVLDVPNGTYELSADMRNSGGGYYLFASTLAPVADENENLVLDASATNVLALAEPVAIDVHKYIDSAAEEATAVYFSEYGEYWKNAADTYLALTGVTGATAEYPAYEYIADATAGVALEGYEEEWNILNANEGKGRGWFKKSLQITVTDHKLCVGVTNDSVFTEGLSDNEGNATVPFTGTWFSANDFKLVMLSEGDNSGWSPATGIMDAKVLEPVSVEAVYSLSGVRLNDIRKGVNIVRYSDGTVKKVLVK